VRKFLARIIVAFAKLVTFPLEPTRRRDARIIVCDLLAPTYPVSTKHGELVFDAGFRWSLRSASVFPRWEPDTRDWIDEFPEGACFWDIGANVGMFSLYSALRPGIRVLAFEPAGNSFAVLNKNIGLNDMEDRIAAYCIAFSDDTKLDTLYMGFANAGSFGTDVNQFDEVVDTKFRQGCVGFSVDDFMSSFSPPLPTHVKIDVDGLEAAIVRGGRTTFASPSVRSMLVEVEGDPTSPRNREIMASMTEFGFTARPLERPECRNIIFDRTPV